MSRMELVRWFREYSLKLMVVYTAITLMWVGAETIVNGYYTYSYTKSIIATGLGMVCIFNFKIIRRL